MNAPLPGLQSPPAAKHADRRPRTWGLAALIAAFSALAYANSLHGPFLFDDADSIVDNPTIRHLSGAIWHPPGGGITVEGRPVLNVSLALNYAAGGTHVLGYHLANLGIHLAAALALFGLFRRLLRAAGEEENATVLGFAVALLWAVHPLQTEAVTYVIQRAESLMALFYLLTLYCFVRYAEAAADRRVARGSVAAGAEDGRGPGPSAGRGDMGADARGWAAAGWASLAVAACAAGMATKEVMVSAPVLVLLCDRTFFAPGWRAAWRRRRGFYGCLCGTWLLLAALVYSTHGRGGTAGFGSGVPVRLYWATQFPAILHYLRLVAWPHPLVFDYAFDRFWLWHPMAAVPAALGIAALLAGCAVALFRRSVFGFLGVWFFAILAPTSVIPGSRQALAEHRMYLALAPVLGAVVLGAAAVGRRLGAARMTDGAAAAGARRRFATALAVIAVVVALPLAVATQRRNRTYQSALALWGDTAARAPDNPYAHSSYASALFDAGRLADAEAELRAALRINPEYPQAHANLGGVYTARGWEARAEAEYRRALQLDPSDSRTHLVHGLSRLRFGHPAEAAAEFAAAVRLKPDLAEAEFGWGNALLALGRPADAAGRFSAAIRLRPGFIDAHKNRGNALADLGRTYEALAEYREVLQLNPADGEACNNIGTVLAQSGRMAQAAAAFADAVALTPDSVQAHANYAKALRALGRIVESDAQFREAARLDANGK